MSMGYEMVNKLWILSLDTQDAGLELVGGKGANLARLANAGFPVPGGFLVTTDAYRAFVAANGLGERILERLGDMSEGETATSAALNAGVLQQASTDIRSWFADGTIPDDIATQLHETYRSFNNAPVAVRSSATAEDLPDMSFAGQQDTFLNVVGQDALLEAVVNCWSSLWTARAIGYRQRNSISHADVALSVVVQQMVQSEASGVMFTANPLTGLRSEIVIDATLGLGEALVSGLVEPDHYVVDVAQDVIVSKQLGAKGLVIRGVDGGGVVEEKTAVSTAFSADVSTQQALPDAQILALAQLGKQVAADYNFPQDIEWAWANGQLYLLQSRPITSLHPLPDDVPADPVHVLFSFASVQGIMEPMTPLGQDAIRLIFAGGASLLGFDMTYETQGVIKIAGERLWGNMTPLLRHPIGQKMAPRFFSAIDPTIVPVLETLKNDPKLGMGTGRLRLSTFRRIVKFMVPFYRRLFRHWRHVETAAKQIERFSDQEIARLQAVSDAIPPGTSQLAHHINLFREIRNGFVFAVPEIATGAAGGLIPLFLLTRVSNHLTGSSQLALEMTRGLPHNVTTEMDLALWQTAQTIRADGAALRLMQDNTANQLAADYMDGKLVGVAQTAVSTFLTCYGMRGLGEIDIGRPRWCEEPTHIMQVLQSYLQIEDAVLAPDVVFKRGEQSAEVARVGLETAVSKTFAGKLKVKLVRKLTKRMRALAGLRESPKFHIIQKMGIMREGLLNSGAQLVASGVIDQPDDLFYLYLKELEALAENPQNDWRPLIAERRANYDRELLRNQLPRLLLSDGRTFYEGLSAVDDEDGVLRGSPVSPGVVEGTVRVVLDPQQANLAPGEILVCPGTDPAWTPLFLAAGGLVMEVGGLMTHGAIVAREYGIPAVVGVHQATTRLQTGQRIQVDGSTGQIQLFP